MYQSLHSQSDHPSKITLIIPRSEHPISRKMMDEEALKVIYGLHRHGFIAYLVGGSARDLLLR
jgi:poly(A) polymerase